MNQPQIPANALLEIQQMLQNNIPKEYVEMQLKKWGMDKQYKIENNQLFEVGDSTSAWLNRLITNNMHMLTLKEEVKKLALIDDEVLITGATGTGKELIARALHGEEREGRFVAVNCAGLPEHLVESIMFGHVQGAFTGATTGKDGLMQAAAKGTFFLDEIGKLPLSLQGKFLRAIQEKTITKVGGDKDIKITCRIICATNLDLEEMVEEDRFLIDLYARISVFELHTIPLKERPEDVVPIIESLDGGREFLKAMNDHHPMFNAAALLDTKLNVRSLQRAVKRYKVLQKLPQ